MIDPKLVAFDIDGVVADTMRLFVDIARDEFNLQQVRYEAITTYSLAECFDIDSEVLFKIVMQIIDGGYRATLKPIDGAAEVLRRISKHHRPIHFVTARPYLGPIQDWIVDTIEMDADAVEVITTGSHEEKAKVLLQKGISYFIEDRLETCFLLREAGITPILFKQAWNRQPHTFMEVESWKEIESLIKY